MKIYLATDHAGFELKEKIKIYLTQLGYDVEDCGAYTYDASDDYPDFIAKAAAKVAQDMQSVGIIFGGSGQAEQIVANKFSNVRAALFYGPCVPVGEADVSGRKSEDPFEIVRLSREHNNTNVLSLGARFLTEEQAVQAVKVWLDTPFSNEERHQRRIDKIAHIEEANEY